LMLLGTFWNILPKPQNPKTPCILISNLVIIII